MAAKHPRNNKHGPFGPGPSDGTPTHTESVNPLVAAKGICTHLRPDGHVCGWVHTRCSGHLSSSQYPERTGDPCSRLAAKGSTVCVTHGAGAPQVRLSAERRRELMRAEGEVGDLLEACRIEVAGRSTVDALDDARERAAAMVMAIGIRMSQLPVKAEFRIEHVYDDKGAPHTLVTVEQEGLIGPDHSGDMKAHVLASMYGEWLDRLARIEKIAADLGLEERRVRIEEAQVVELEESVLEMLRRLGVQLSIDIPEDVAVGLLAEVLRARAIDTTATELPPGEVA